jgi:hypothetical protein
MEQKRKQHLHHNQGCVPYGNGFHVGGEIQCEEAMDPRFAAPPRPPLGGGQEAICRFEDLHPPRPDGAQVACGGVQTGGRREGEIQTIPLVPLVRLHYWGAVALIGATGRTFGREIPLGCVWLGACGRTQNSKISV